MLDRPNDRMLKAFTGLEGGVVARGSTCGVVTAGAAGLALRHLDLLMMDNPAAEAGVMSLVRDYTRWFETRYGTCLCRNRTGVDFHRPRGQARYFVPGDRVARCLWHIRGAAGYFQTLTNGRLPESNGETTRAENDVRHCATSVLARIRERTGLGDDTLERVAFVYDGGVGLSGGVCGALIGAVLGLNLLLGMEIRGMSYPQTVRAFIVGHRNLLIDKRPDRPEPFYAGKTLVSGFFAEAGALECAAITGRRFTSCRDWRQHIASDERCRWLMERAADLAVTAIEEWK